ncbi:MAG: LPS assembly lipoprotein LptE [Planctomycetia bacterium]|jgi:hypothetical protein
MKKIAFYRWLLLCTLVVVTTGCAGYRFGNRTLYPPHIRTVYVPTCESSSFRPFLGERLTEAIVKEVEQKTPYKVVSTPEEADSILTCRIVDEGKRVVAENYYDDPRQVQYWFNVQVNWIDRQQQQICPGGAVSIPRESVDLLETSNMAAEVGQSGATAQQDAINKIATRVVTMMEAPW